MANRSRGYMDRLLGKNEGNEARDFSHGRRYEEHQSFSDESGDFPPEHSERPIGADRRSFWNDDFYSERTRRYGRFPERGRDRGHYGKGPKNWTWSDTRIKEQVSESLYRDYNVDASDIEVEVNNGVVTLSGTVSDRGTKRSAEECIENLIGVRDVHNRLRILEQSSPEKGALS